MTALYVLPTGHEILKSNIGWSGTVNPRTTRKYAVRYNGNILRTSSGARRTFATSAAAAKAVTEGM